MDMDNGVGIACGLGEAGGMGTKEENWDNCNSINNKIQFLKKKCYKRG